MRGTSTNFVVASVYKRLHESGSWKLAYFRLRGFCCGHISLVHHHPYREPYYDKARELAEKGLYVPIRPELPENTFDTVNVQQT
jgi:hypothetical protein